MKILILSEVNLFGLFIITDRFFAVKIFYG